MSGFESSAEAAWLNGAIGKRAGLIQGRNEGAAIGYEAGWDDGLAEGQQQAARAAQARLDAMQAQIEALQTELSSTRAAYQRVHAKWTADKEFLAGLIVVTTARRPPILQRPERDPDLHIRYGSYKAPTLLGGATAQPTNKMSQSLANTIGDIVLDLMLVLLLLGLLWLIVAVAVSTIRRWRLRETAWNRG